MHILKFLLIFIFSQFIYCLDKCDKNFVIRLDSIIETHKSEENGAEFLFNKQSSSVDECYKLCCEHKDCTTAVFQNKDNRMCYLFDCKQPNVCLFSEHKKYVAIVAQPQKSSPIAEKAKLNNNNNNNNNKDELNSNMEEGNKNSNSKNSLNENNKIHQSSKDIVVPVPQKSIVMVKLGSKCDNLNKCLADHSDCAHGRCVCKNNFVEKRGKCVASICSKPDLMFQCDDTQKFPNCIASYDRCNGVVECGDKSDEKDCPIENLPQMENVKSVGNDDNVGKMKQSINNKAVHIDSSSRKTLSRQRPDLDYSYEPIPNNEQKNSLSESKMSKSSPSSSSSSSSSSSNHHGDHHMHNSKGTIQHGEMEQQLSKLHDRTHEGGPRRLQQMIDKDYNWINVPSQDRYNPGDAYDDYDTRVPADSDSNDYNPSPWDNSYSSKDNNNADVDDNRENIYQIISGYRNVEPMEGKPQSTKTGSRENNNFKQISVDEEANPPSKSSSDEESLKTNKKAENVIVDDKNSNSIRLTKSDLDMLKSSNHQSRVALIALSFSLLVTFALLVYVVLRYRAARARLRRRGNGGGRGGGGGAGGKGRLTTDEEDYLINGMYL